MLSLGLNLRLLGLCLHVGLAHDVLGLLVHRGICVLHEIFVSLLGIFLTADGLSLHGLGIIDDGLHHTHDTTRGRVLLVRLEPWGRWWSGWLLAGLSLYKCGLLVEALEDVEGGGKKFLCCTLVGHRGLKLLVHLLAVLTGTLHLHLKLSYLGLEGLNLPCKSIDGTCKVLDLGNEIIPVALFHLSVALVVVEFLNAEVLVLDL